MEIKHEHAEMVLLAWAAEVGQAHVANKIAESYISLGIGKLPLRDGDTWNNQQYIFHRWLKGVTAQQRGKIQQLVPAIVDALPVGLAAQLLAAESVEYRALDAAERSVQEAKSAFMRNRKAIFMQECRASRNGGSSGNTLIH